MRLSTSFQNTWDLYQKSECMNLIVEAKDSLGDLYLGNFEAARNVQLLKSKKINSVLSIASRTQLKYDQNKIKNHLIIPAEDISCFDLYSYFDQIVAWIEQARQMGNVLVHCFAGISRSSSGIIAYLMNKYGQTFTEALAYCKAKRPIVDPNPGFVHQLQQYETALQTARKGKINNSTNNNQGQGQQQSQYSSSNQQLTVSTHVSSSQNLGTANEKSYNNYNPYIRPRSQQTNSYHYFTPQKIRPNSPTPKQDMMPKTEQKQNSVTYGYQSVGTVSRINLQPMQPMVTNKLGYYPPAHLQNPPRTIQNYNYTSIFKQQGRMTYNTKINQVQRKIGNISGFQPATGQILQISQK